MGRRMFGQRKQTRSEARDSVASSTNEWKEIRYGSSRMGEAGVG